MKVSLGYLVVILFIRSFFQSDQFALASKLNESKQYQECLKICSGEIKKLKINDSLFTKFLALRADAYANSNDFEGAISDYKELIKIHPSNTAYYTGLSFFYGEKGDFPSSIDILKKGLIINNKDAYILGNLSYYCGQSGDFSASIAYASKGLSVATDDQSKGSLFNNRGYGYLKTKKYDLALTDINNAIKLAPDNSFAYCYRALVNIETKKMETVCQDLAQSKKLGGVKLTVDLIKKYCSH